jgi:hypothetical protein
MSAKTQASEILVINDSLCKAVPHFGQLFYIKKNPLLFKREHGDGSCASRFMWEWNFTCRKWNHHAVHKKIKQGSLQSCGKTNHHAAVSNILY